MAAGKYRTLCLVYRPTNGPQVDGSIGQSLGAELFRFWGRKKSVGAAAEHGSVQRDKKITHRIMTRYRDDMTDDLILVADGWRYHVRRTAEYEGDGKELAIEVEMIRQNA